MSKRGNGGRENSLSAILIESIHTLVYEKDIHVALNRFLEMIGSYYKADRAYIFEFDDKGEIMDNTFEWCAAGIKAERERRQGIRISIIESWMKKFREEGEFYIAMLEDEISRDRADLELLKEQKIDSLMAAPLLWEDEIVGFLGVDNPAKRAGNMTLLRSVVDFVTADLEKRRLIEKLLRAGSIDELTGLKNRNEYMRKYKELKNKKPDTLGVIFIDINGLKQLNDTYGHERGDEAIKRVAEIIREHTMSHAYRIGGDEFVILWDNIDKESFSEKAEELKAAFQSDSECSISMGDVWQDGVIDVERQVKEADVLMYKEKQIHYQNRNYDRRKRR